MLKKSMCDWGQYIEAMTINPFFVDPQRKSRGIACASDGSNN